MDSKELTIKDLRYCGLTEAAEILTSLNSGSVAPHTLTFEEALLWTSDAEVERCIRRWEREASKYASRCARSASGESVDRFDESFYPRQFARIWASAFRQERRSRAVRK